MLIEVILPFCSFSLLSYCVFAGFVCVFVCWIVYVCACFTTFVVSIRGYLGSGRVSLSEGVKVAGCRCKGLF